MNKILLLALCISLFSGCFSEKNYFTNISYFKPKENLPLQNTYWSLKEMNNEDITQIKQQPEIHLVFHINDKSLHGSDGCNRINALYSIDKEVFSLTQLSVTRMSCKEGIQQAEVFLKILKKANKIKIKEDNLILFRDDTELAKFEAKKAY